MGPAIASPRTMFAAYTGYGSAPIYPWAGEYRSVNIGKGGFQFAHAPRIGHLMAELERETLRRHTPCQKGPVLEIARALAEVHAELILVHPFRDGNGRLARLLMLLMALQAGLPPLDFSPLDRAWKTRLYRGHPRGNESGLHVVDRYDGARYRSVDAPRRFQWAMNALVLAGFFVPFSFTKGA